MYMMVIYYCQVGGFTPFRKLPEQALWAFGGRFGLLGTVPDCHDPDCLASYSIEEPVGPDDYFTVGKIGKLGKRAARFRVSLQPAKPLFDAPTKPGCCAGLVTTDVLESVKKLGAR